MEPPKKPKRPIDVKRDSAGSFSIDEPDGKIEVMLVIDDAMIVVSTKAVYRSLLADQVDPERTDFNLLKMIQQRILDYGSDAPFILQTLGMARELFDSTHLGEKFSKDKALSLALKAAHEFAAAADILTSFEADQIAGAEKLASAIKGSSLNLPTVKNLHSRLSSYLNHLRAACLALIEIAQLFYPKAKKNDGWRVAFDAGIKEFLERSQFRGTAEYLCEYIEMMSNMRNAVEHPDSSKNAVVTDFRAIPGGFISKPRLVLIFKQKKIVDSDIDYFMKLFLGKTGEAFEDMCALLCDANIVPFGPVEARVVTEQAGESTGPRRYRYFSKFKQGFEPPSPITPNS
jgi:hypothetical protein